MANGADMVTWDSWKQWHGNNSWDLEHTYAGSWDDSWRHSATSSWMHSSWIGRCPTTETRQEPPTSQKDLSSCCLQASVGTKEVGNHLQDEASTLPNDMAECHAKEVDEEGNVKQKGEEAAQLAAEVEAQATRKIAETKTKEEDTVDESRNIEENIAIDAETEATRKVTEVKAEEGEEIETKLKNEDEAAKLATQVEAETTNGLAETNDAKDEEETEARPDSDEAAVKLAAEVEVEVARKVAESKAEEEEMEATLKSEKESAKLAAEAETDATINVVEIETKEDVIDPRGKCGEEVVKLPGDAKAEATRRMIEAIAKAEWMDSKRKREEVVVEGKVMTELENEEESAKSVEIGRIFTYCDLQSQFVDSFDTTDIDAYWHEKCMPHFHSSGTGSTYTRQQLLLARPPSSEGDHGMGVMLLSTPWPSVETANRSESRDLSQTRLARDYRSRDESKLYYSEEAVRNWSGSSSRQSARNLERASKPLRDDTKTTLWIGPLPLPCHREADEREIRALLEGLWIYKVEIYRQYAYVTVSVAQSWDVRVRIMNRSIRHGPRLHAQERVETCDWVPIQASPLDIAFSQAEIADRFRDERLLEESVAETEEQSLAQGWSLLAPPFDPIRVVGDGHRYITLDNQRLYVLQRRAVELWPRPCLVDVFLCHGPTPSEFWAKLSTRASGDRVVILSGIPSNYSDEKRWSSITKWSRAWCCEEAIAEAEMKLAEAPRRPVYYQASAGSEFAAKWKSMGCDAKQYESHHYDNDKWWSQYRGTGYSWIAKASNDSSWHASQSQLHTGTTQESVSVSIHESAPPAGEMPSSIDMKNTLDQRGFMSEGVVLENVVCSTTDDIAASENATDVAVANEKLAIDTESKRDTRVEVVSENVAIDSPAEKEASYPEDRRMEPESGKVYTLCELESAFSGQFTLDEIHAYWRDACTPEEHAVSTSCT